jgi:hypothetical protein
MSYTNKVSSFMLSHIYLYNLWTFLTKNLCVNIKITAVILCVRLRSEKLQLHNVQKRVISILFHVIYNCQCEPISAVFPSCFTQFQDAANNI